MSGAKVNFKLVVLWEDEIRAAAKALALFRKDDRDLSHEEAGDIVSTCITALLGAEDDDAVILMSRKPGAQP